MQDYVYRGVMNLREAYAKMNYKVLMLIPLAIFLICTGFLFFKYFTMGEFFEKSFDLKGGAHLTIDVENNVDINKLESYLKQKLPDVEVREIFSISGKSLLIRTGEEVSEDDLLKMVEDYGLKIKSHSFLSIESKLGESFFSQSRLALIIAFIFMGAVVFFIFKSFAPSMAVIFAAFSDIICTLAIMQVIGLKLSLASFAALLMVLGYSIDTDILLTTRLLKRREGSIIDRSIGAIKTGLTMTSTTLVALCALLFAAKATVLQEIASDLIIALLIDLPNTWLMNLGILRWCVERREK